MELLVALVLLALAAYGGYALIRSMRSKQSKGVSAPVHKDPLAPEVGLNGDPRLLKVADVVTYAGRDHSVRGSLRLDEDGYTWAEHFLDDASGTRVWLSVESDPELEVVLWREVDAELVPGEKTLTHDGVTYRLDEKGRARYRSEGTTGLPETGSVEYYDYDGGSGRYLSFERFVGTEWEVGVGEELRLSELLIYPAS